MKEFFKFTFASMLGFFIASIIALLLVFGMIASLASFMEKEQTIVAENTLLRIDFKSPISDRTTDDPFSEFDFVSMESNKPIGLNDVLKNLEKAGKDPNIKGIYLNLTMIQAGFSNVAEIREALLRFKESGKFIVAYSEMYSQAAYYLASTADEIYIHPEGMFDFRGLFAELTFFKGTIEKLDAEMQIIRHGKYKSAVEPFMLDKMSPENREQMDAIVNALWDKMTGDIAKSRNLSQDELNKIANDLLIKTPKDALGFGMVDGLKYQDEIAALLKEKLEIGKDDKIEKVSLAAYTTAPEPGDVKVDRKNRIAVVYAVGEIISGEGSDNIIGSDRIAKAIRDARKDDKVKAIVMRVNSPGGSALASDVILREAKLAAEEKPFYVSMGNVAASGGYYIACAADKIFAEPTTITGSIGVLGMIPNLENTMKNKLGITFDYVQTNENANIFSTNRPLTPFQKEVIQEYIEEIYHTFVTHVSEGRKMTWEQVDEIGQGRVWVGADAHKIGLVDELGGLEATIAAIVEAAELETYSIKEFPEQKDFFQELLNELTGQTRIENKLKSELGENYQLYQYLKYWQNASGVQARMPFNIHIN
jgi:protease IV